MAPLYEHDCSHCTFLGTWQDMYDLYVCRNDDYGPDCYVARVSSEGSDYSSASTRTQYPPLVEARRRDLHSK